jgi:hypothetical protein
VGKQSQEGPPGDFAGSMEITLSREARLAVVHFAPRTSLTGRHGAALVHALEEVRAATSEPFALLADTSGVWKTDAEYRASTGTFFRQHRDVAAIALINLSPFIRVVAEMFRVAIDLELRAFDDEAGARAWLRTKGVAA